MDEPLNSVLERFLILLEETAPLRVSVEDYLGILGDIPGMAISERFFGHECSFCRHAKYDRGGFRYCFANKRSVNRLLQNHKRGFSGQCHLGVTDIIEPVIVDGICVAGLFYGSVLLVGTEAQARHRIRKHCLRTRQPVDPYLQELAALPRIKAEELAVMRERLRLLSDLMARIIGESGIPVARYQQERDGQTARKRAKLPSTLQAALRYMGRAFKQPITRTELARYVHCNENYLSGLFTSHLGMSFRAYLTRLRLDRAKTLLRNTSQTAGEIAFAVGFESQSYFNRCFREDVGMSPSKWREKEKLSKSP